MNKDLLITWLVEDATKYADKCYGRRRSNLKKDLYEINNRRKIDLPSSLPKSKNKMISVLRRHFKNDVSFISLVLNHYFPEEFIFYRVSALENEIFEGFEFLEAGFTFGKIGEKGFDRYLEFNDSLIQFAHDNWPDLKYPQKRVAYFLYQGLANLFLEKSNYNRYWVAATKEKYFRALDYYKDVSWSGRKEMKKGDLVFMYRMDPRKAITDIFTVEYDPFFSPWGAWGGFDVYLKRLARIEDIKFSEMREDPVLKEWNVVKKQFQGTVTDLVPHSIYNRLLEKIPKSIKGEFSLQPEAVLKGKYSGKYASEEEFDEEFVMPLLRQWGFRYQYQHPSKFCTGTQYHHCKVDFYVSDENGPLTLFEDKFRIMSEKELEPATDQAKSYALMLGLASFVIASPEGIWIYKLNKNKEELIKKFASDEVQKHNEEIRNLLQGLRR